MRASPRAETPGSTRACATGRGGSAVSHFLPAARTTPELPSKSPPEVSRCRSQVGSVSDGGMLVPYALEPQHRTAPSVLSAIGDADGEGQFHAILRLYA